MSAPAEWEGQETGGEEADDDIMQLPVEHIEERARGLLLRAVVVLMPFRTLVVTPRDAYAGFLGNPESSDRGIELSEEGRRAARWALDVLVHALNEIRPLDAYNAQWILERIVLGVAGALSDRTGIATGDALARMGEYAADRYEAVARGDLHVCGEWEAE